MGCGECVKVPGRPALTNERLTILQFEDANKLKYQLFLAFPMHKALFFSSFRPLNFPNAKLLSSTMELQVATSML
jgi:hypothetical protein